MKYDRPYSLRTVVSLPFDDALAKTREALPEEGFGVITEIDVRKTMKEKLNVDSRPYVILGACNPQVAHRALTAEPDIGLLLPCNVVVYEAGEHQSVVAAIDPFTMIDLVGDRPELRAIAEDTRARLLGVLAAVAAQSPQHVTS
jgi:uncharacterized protein (DUF302 family)